jgi:nucleoid-associated protein YgaU
VAAAEEAKPPGTGEKLAHRKRHRPRVYTVRRGDTLWEIAEAYYGGGWHYRAIARDNRRQIHNPHWIYPKQKFHIPSGK